MNCGYCEKEFKNKKSLGGHIPCCPKNPFRTRIRKVKNKKIEFICECGKTYDSGIKLGGHKVWCNSNPNNKNTRDKISISSKRPHSIENKKKMSELINEKVKNGTWHLSFAHSRIHEYAGIKFHGTWELRYAKWLDLFGIKWRRPLEKFEYQFENKKRFYTPDFYLLEEQCYIEIKGYPTPKDFAKWTQFPLGLNLKILSGKNLFELNIIDSYKRSNIIYKDTTWM